MWRQGKGGGKVEDGDKVIPRKRICLAGKSPFLQSTSSNGWVFPLSFSFCWGVNASIRWDGSPLRKQSNPTIAFASEGQHFKFLNLLKVICFKDSTMVNFHETNSTCFFLSSNCLGFGCFVHV